MRDVLEAKGYSHRYVEYNGGHEFIWWRGTFAEGLMALIGRGDGIRRITGGRD